MAEMVTDVQGEADLHSSKVLSSKGIMDLDPAGAVRNARFKWCRTFMQLAVGYYMIVLSVAYMENFRLILICYQSM